jgi:hypothetical protein
MVEDVATLSVLHFINLVISISPTS